MNLPITWVDQIFARLTVRYGDRFLNRWSNAGVDLDLVRQDWSRELAGFKNWPGAIAFAIANLDAEKPPTAAMFRTIALRAPKPDRVALPEPAADPERIAAELAKLAPLQQATATAGPKDDKAWAHKIIARYEYGQKIGVYALRCAHEALGLPVPGPAVKVTRNGVEVQVPQADDVAEEEFV